MSRPTPRLTNYMTLARCLSELDARMAASCPENFRTVPEFNKGIRLVLIYLQLVYLRNWGGRDVGWPQHMADLGALNERYFKGVEFNERWLLDNDLPEDELLVALTIFLVHEFKKYDNAPGGFKTNWWHSTQEYLHTLVRDHLRSVRQPTVAELRVDTPDRDYFNNWTGQNNPSADKE